MEFHLKLKNEKVVFASDLHLGHDKDFVWGARGFSSAKEHSTFIFDTWAQDIDADTIVVNLGDSVFGDPEAVLARRLAQLPCKRHYVLWGNHNSGLKQLFGGRSLTLREEVESSSAFTHLGDYALANVNGLFAALFHFPILVPDGLAKGSCSIGGHSHGSFAATNPNRKEFGSLGPIIDVGVDCALEWSGGKRFFFSLEEVRKFLDKVERKRFDHHQ